MPSVSIQEQEVGRLSRLDPMSSRRKLATIDCVRGTSFESETTPERVIFGTVARCLCLTVSTACSYILLETKYSIMHDPSVAQHTRNERLPYIGLS